MSSVLKNRLIKYGCSGLFIALFAGSYVAANAEVAQLPVDWYRILCDAFSVPGILLILVGGLLWIAGQGALDGVVYCVRWAVFSLIPGKRLERDMRYAEYVEAKQDKRPSGYGFLFFSGLFSMAIALVFLVLFYQHFE